MGSTALSSSEGEGGDGKEGNQRGQGLKEDQVVVEEIGGIAVVVVVVSW